MIKKYWIEIAVSLAMTGLLAFSFSGSEAPRPTSTASADRLAAYQPANPEEPFLVGEYRRGVDSKGLKNWEIKVWGSGKVVVRVEGQTTSSNVSSPSVKSLLDRLRRENALDLSKFPPVTGGSTLLVLRTHLAGGQAELTLPYLKDAKGSVESRRFMRIWADLLTEIPSPNGEKPIEYL